MRYAFVCFFPAVPPESGAGRVSYDLARFVPIDSTLIQLGWIDSDWVDPAGLRVIQIQQGGEGRWRKMYGIPRFVGRVVEHLAELRPDVVVLEGASWVLYHWLLLRSLRKGLPGVKIVYHAHNVEYLLRREKHGWLVRGLTRSAEGRLLRSADQSFAVSDVDRDAFEVLYGIRPGLLPNGVDVAQFSDVSDDAIQTCRERYGLSSDAVLFMGSYAYLPNREAIDFLVTQVMPGVLERRPDTQLAIIGGEVPYRRDWLRCPGTIPDEWVAPFVRSCAVSVAPIFSGSGTRLKILASLAAGIPVVSTAKGAEGLGLADRTEILLAESAQGFVDAVNSLFIDSGRRTALGRRGQARVATSYAANLLADRFHATLLDARRA